MRQPLNPCSATRGAIIEKLACSNEDPVQQVKKKRKRKCSKLMGFPGGTSGKEPTCQCRRHKRLGFSPWMGTIPWRKKWQPTPVFLPGKSYGQRGSWWATVHGVEKSWTWLKWPNATQEWQGHGLQTTARQPWAKSGAIWTPKLRQ